MCSHTFSGLFKCRDGNIFKLFDGAFIAVNLLLSPPQMIGRQVIIEQVNHTSSFLLQGERERERERRGGLEGGAGLRGRFLFLLELVLNNCTAVCISVRAGCQAAYKISCVEKSPA